MFFRQSVTVISFNSGNDSYIKRLREKASEKYENYFRTALKDNKHLLDPVPPNFVARTKTMLNLDKTTATSDLFVDLNEKDAETISGGYEVFQITNNTNYNVSLSIDGTSFVNRPGETWTYTAHGGGSIEFDTDGRAGYAQWKTYDLAEGGVYEFADNGYTRGNPYDIDLYVV